MANRLTFRSEINEWSADGFVRAIEALPARSTCDMYLSTPGGEIYAGGEMINAIHAAIARGIKFEIEVGSLCASMGAALIAAAKAAGAKIEVHPNTEVMFHGCWSLIVGGADELTDQAKAMRDFNSTVQADLAKLGITDTDEWFAADRQKWLNAKELVELGLADSILETAAEDADSKEDALKIAASLNHKKESKMEKPTDEKPVATTAESPAPEVTEKPVEEQTAQAPTEETATATETAPAETAEKPVETTPAATADEIDARVTMLANERFKGLQSAHDKMISDLTKDRDSARAELDTAKAALTTLRADVEKLKENHTKEIENLRAQLAQSEANRESIVVSALERHEDNFAGDPRAHLASLPPDQREAYYKAHAAEIDKK